MFDAECTICGPHVLLSTRRITALRNTERGIEIEFECWCGTLGHILTGRRADRPAAQVRSTNTS